ncbi:S24 family peptidase [Roseibium sp.]|uniref:S24 family peptidase n=1 Tax=Roseibium sp. TaxID=1936156 RepID=UPI003A97278E
MLSHAQVWAAIDGLAQRNGLSPSGLAKRAGLDPTTFNPSKRFASDGRPRWPSTESLAKILEATGEALGQFVAGMGAHAGSEMHRELPMTGLSEAASEDTFDPKGLPAGKLWSQMAFPDPSIRGQFALKVSGDEMLPLYRDGDVIIVARDMPLRRGDRVVVKVRHRALTVLLLDRRTESGMEFAGLDHDGRVTHVSHEDIDWIGRILWASQ